MKGLRYGWLLAISFLVLPAMLQAAGPEPLTFQKAIELAMRRSTNVNVAAANQMLAHSSYLEARNAYIPAITVGSGLGKSWGFPLTLEGSAPSIFNVNAQSALLNFSQKEFMKAARTEWTSTSTNLESERDQALLDTAVTYAQLNATQEKLKVLQRQGEDAQQVLYVTQQRVEAGVDAQVELTRANLNAARTRLKMAETEGTVQMLKQHLAQLTGLDAASLEVVSDSMPKVPENEAQDVVAKALASSTAIKVAEEHARSKEQQAKGEHKALYPTVDFAAQYAVLSRYNNYDQYYQKFERNNATVGVAIRFPFLNPVQRAHAEAADAEALRARSEANAVRHQVANQALKLQTSLQQLAAARDVARLEWQLAQSDLDSATAQLKAGNGNLREQETAKVEVNDKYAAFLDTSFEFEKAVLQLMQVTGDLRTWALAGQ